MLKGTSVVMSIFHENIKNVFRIQYTLFSFKLYFFIICSCAQKVSAHKLNEFYLGVQSAPKDIRFKPVLP